MNREGFDSGAGASAHPLAAACYADRAMQREVQVVENVALARDTYRLRLECPAVARQFVPGQFLMLRLPDRDDPLLARPFALFDTVCDQAGQPIGIDLVYLVVGRMTRRLAATRPGDRLVLWGPLGNGFSPHPIDHLVMVAGGIGQTPFLALAREALGNKGYGQTARPQGYARRATLCYGVRTADLLAGADDFTAHRVDLRISSDDGSVGHHGLVTDLVGEILRDEDPSQMRIATCGPEPMLRAVTQLATEAGVACEVSLETPMACGLGICFSCVAKLRDAETTTDDSGAATWDYKRTCVDGPVFDARRIVW